MKLLLDTRILLWAAGQPERLSAAARKQLRNPRNELLFSAASLRGISIKRSLGREDFRVEPRLRHFSASRARAIGEARCLLHGELLALPGLQPGSRSEPRRWLVGVFGDVVATRRVRTRALAFADRFHAG